MVDPVFIGGKTYDRVNITDWLNRHGTHPITQKPIDSKDLVPNDDVRSDIYEFMQTKLKEILKDIPKFMSPEFFELSIELIDLADEYNVIWKNDYSPKIICCLLSVVP